MKSVFACSLGPLCCSHFSLNHLPSTLLQPLEPVNPGALITSPILYPRRVEFPAQWKEPCESEQPGLCPSKESSALSDYSSVGEALCLPQELQGQITKVLWGLRILPFNISLTCTRFVHFLFICYLFLSWVFLWVNMSSMVSCLLLPSLLFFLPFFFLRHHLIYFKAFQIPKMWTVEWSALCPYNDSGLSWPFFICTIWFYFIRTLCIWTVINNTESGKKKKKNCKCRTTRSRPASAETQSDISSSLWPQAILSSLCSQARTTCFNRSSSHMLQIAPLALLSLQLWVKHHPLHQCWQGWILAHALMDFGCASALQV